MSLTLAQAHARWKAARQAWMELSSSANHMEFREAEAALLAVPEPQERGTWFPCAGCGSGTAPLLDSVDSGTTLVCDKCGHKTVIQLIPDPVPEPQGPPQGIVHQHWCWKVVAEHHPMAIAGKISCTCGAEPAPAPLSAEAEALQIIFTRNGRHPVIPDEIGLVEHVRQLVEQVAAPAPAQEWQ